MSMLSAREVALLAKSVGVPDSQLIYCVAICFAESSGNTQATGYNGPTQGCPNGSRDRGLWQINDCYHPDVSDACAYDSGCNAKAMFAISNRGTNWNPWATWQSGAWLEYRSAAQSAVNGLTASNSGSAVSSAAYNPVSDLKAAIDKGGNPFQAAFNVVGHMIEHALAQAGF